MLRLAHDGSLLWYRSPAEQWVEALPVGNGRLGAMVFGGVGSERWQLNEDSLWTGGPEDADNPAAYPALAEIRSLLFQGRYAEAQRLTDATQIRKASGRGEFGSYTTLGELVLSDSSELAQAGASGAAAAPTDYRRELNLKQAMVKSQYRLSASTYTRETFASAPDQVLVIRLSVSGPTKLGFRLSLSRPEAEARAIGADALLLSGRLRQRSRSEGSHSGHDQPDGMQFAARVQVIALGGSVEPEAGGLRVVGAHSVLILVPAGTDYHELDLGQLWLRSERGQNAARLASERRGRFEAKLERQIDAARALGFTKLEERHRADYAPLFARVELSLPTDASSESPTDERLLRGPGCSLRGACDAPRPTVASFPLSAWFVQLELEHFLVLEKVLVRGVDGELPTERG